MIKLKFTIATLIMVCVFTGHTMAQLEFYDPGTQKNISTKKASEYTLEDIPSVDGLLRSANPEWFEEYMNAVQDELMYPGVSACVLRDGQLFWKSHHGLSNIGAATPVTDETAYTVASISKTIMITAVMQLFEQQLFGLDDDISDHM